MIARQVLELTGGSGEPGRRSNDEASRVFSIDQAFSRDAELHFILYVPSADFPAKIGGCLLEK